MEKSALCENGIEVVQKSAIGSSTTQIAVQYVGMTPEEALKLTIDLFNQNFPKLQEEARRIANERADELGNKILENLANKGINNLSAFSDPDVQYVVLEAQKKYARFGNKGMLGVLSDLISSRIQHDKKTFFNRIVDNAILVACELSEEQLNCLSALFILTRVVFRGNSINNINDLEVHYQHLIKAFGLDKVNYKKQVSYLQCMKCLDLQLPDIAKIMSKRYNLPINEVKKITPQCISQFSGDYGISDIGILLAISNAEIKTNYYFNPFIWIPEN